MLEIAVVSGLRPPALKCFACFFTRKHIHTSFEIIDAIGRSVNNRSLRAYMTTCFGMHDSPQSPHIVAKIKESLLMTTLQTRGRSCEYPGLGVFRGSDDRIHAASNSGHFS